MFISALKQAFSRWWDKLGFATLNSTIAAINPFFLFLHLGLLWILTNKVETVQPYNQFFILFLPTAFLIQIFFPTTFAALDYNKKLSENESIYLKKLPHDLWESFKKTFIPSLKFTAIFGIVGLILGFNLVFYTSMIANNPIRWVLLLIAAWIYLIFGLMQYIIPSLIIYNPKLKLKETFKYAFSLSVGFGAPVILIFIVDTVIFFMLMLTRYFSPFIYFGMSSFLRIYLHKTLVARLKAPDKSNKEEETIQEPDMLKTWETILNKDRKPSVDDDK